MLQLLLWALLALRPSPSGAQLYGQLALDANASSLSADGSTLTLAFRYSGWALNYSTLALVPAGTRFSAAAGGASYVLPANLSLAVGAPSVADSDRTGGLPGLAGQGARWSSGGASSCGAVGSACVIADILRSVRSIQLQGTVFACRMQQAVFASAGRGNRLAHPTPWALPHPAPSSQPCS